ncbi:holo-ACP synthase [Candidatus Tisiphia endosymbiont of Beris chalybata]|uniref:holo-ACP synthase n=1 Tax=Candidatus Tisiphia endosymbiont of Beris chalybata TaxID=3066262 RepID=UPI00312C8663
MIVGIGTDIVQIPRIARLLKLYDQLFIKKILSSCEIQQLTSIDKELYSNYIAKRFAAKEAVSKAFGSGIGRGINFTDISVLNDELGKPFVKISSLTDSDPLNNFQIYISLADDYPVAIAFVLISTNRLPL